MINIDEYKSYFNDNYKLIKVLKENNSLTYDRLSDLIKVLNFIMEVFNGKEQVDEEFEIIFESGFAFFHEQFEQIKLYYNNYFNGKYNDFKKYEFFINYSLNLEDMIQSFEEKEALDKDGKEQINKILTEIEDIISNKKTPTLEVLDIYNQTLEDLLFDKPEVLTTIEIFSRIHDELGF